MKVKLIYKKVLEKEVEVEIDDKFAPIADNAVDCPNDIDLVWELFGVGEDMVKEKEGTDFVAFETLDGDMIIEG